MAAPVIKWRQVGGSAASQTLNSIASLNFGTVTAGAWSLVKVVRPSVTVNSIQSCKWWLSDVGAQRSGVSVSVGTAAGWVHRCIIAASAAPKYISATKGSATFGSESPESTASAASYAAVSAGKYGAHIGLALKVASAAGDGATTAWGQLMRPIHRAICVLNSVKFGEPCKMGIPSEALQKERVETRRQIPFWGKGIVQTANMQISMVAKAIAGMYQLKYSYT